MSTARDDVVAVYDNDCWEVRLATKADIQAWVQLLIDNPTVPLWRLRLEIDGKECYLDDSSGQWSQATRDHLAEMAA